MKILWLASWYPEKNDPFNGDFIQRHANALSQFNELTLIHVSGGIPGEKFEGVRKTYNRDGNLYEILVEYPRPNHSNSMLTKFSSFLKYYSTYKSQIKKYIQEKGVPDIVHVHVPFKAGWVGLWLRRKFKIPLVVTEHWAGYDKANPDNYFSRSYYFRSLVRKVLKNSDCVTPVSEDLGKKLAAICRGLKYQVIPNCVNTDYFYFQETAFNRFTFIHNTSPDESHKNTLGFLEVLANLKAIRTDWDCIIFGVPSGNVLERARQFDLEDQVKFTRHILHERVAELMRHASAMVNFSNYENQPCSILEALCCGLPVIAPRVGGIPEIIDDSNGDLISAGNKMELLSAMENLMEKYSGFNRTQIAKSAAEKYNYQQIGKALVNLYSDILNPQATC